MSNIKTQTGKIIGKSLNAYHSRVKPKIDELKFKESYQGRIIDCMVGEVDDNYIETPETDAPIVKLEHSKEGLVKISTIKGKTILVDADGNETDTPAEGCKLVSVGEAEGNKMIILSNNKNLLDDTKFVENGVVLKTDNNTYKITITDWTKIQPKIFDNLNIKGNISISMNVISGNYTGGNLMLFDNEDVKFAEGRGTWKGNVKSLKRIDMYIPQGVCEFTLQIEQGNNVTEYTPHKSHKTEILLDEPLKSLSDSVKDDINKNKINRRLKYIVLNGSEKEWEDWDEQSFVLRGKYFSDAKYNTDGHIQNARSNIYTWGAGNIDMTFRYYRSETVLWSMFTKPNGITTLSDFKQWLSENPIMIIYELEEPIIEELPNSINLQGFDDTTMYIENSITPTVSYGYNALIPYKEELKTQKEEVETNTLDIENNIIPYLMDMEFNLMLMEDN